MNKQSYINLAQRSLVVSALLCSLAPAAYAGVAPSMPVPPVTETTQVKPTETLNLIIDEGQVMQLPRPATSVFVANPAIADVQVKSGNLIYIYGHAPGQTTFYVVDAADKVIASRTVIVGFNLTALRTAIRQLTGANDVTVKQVNDMIMLGGHVENATMAQDVERVATRYLAAGAQGASANGANSMILNRMSILGSNQVNIRVRIAEVSRSSIKTLGVTTNVSNPKLMGNVNIGFGFDSAVNLTGAAAAANAATTMGTTTISAALDALVGNGLATVLAEPNLTSLSGETASFLAGGEFPIPVPDGSGGYTIEYREYGVRLAFTPTVVNGDRISMRIRPEVSDRDDSGAVSFGGGSIPGLITRRAETSVELGSGQSVSIAGLLQNSTAQNVSKYPGLGDLPMIGALFRSDRFQRNETELVIVATPYLVKPVSTQMATPVDGFVPPNDVDRWLNGRMNSEKPTPEAVPISQSGHSAASDDGLVGSVGYIVQ